MNNLNENANCVSAVSLLARTNAVYTRCGRETRPSLVENCCKRINNFLHSIRMMPFPFYRWRSPSASIYSSTNMKQQFWAGNKQFWHLWLCRQLKQYARSNLRAKFASHDWIVKTEMICSLQFINWNLCCFVAKIVELRLDSFCSEYIDRVRSRKKWTTQLRNRV